ncbi:PTS mannitol transporter subunit IIA [Paenibacillus antri]|uniref:Mannitol-specific phosphotransferase enzyme IIA component n=1 Tax=Paenibacillus antri TaxID=2582848 RepID=A0A5R9G4E1_9BACL|nr:PTS sugar transporter subunit IIA [Paenibacillus antri]TLS49206.1 PTS mannitol transporter subunit IIA [Paenibacillus antri]
MTILSTNKVKLGAKAADKNEAIRMAGRLLVEAGHVPEEYIEKMIERDALSSTYMGGGLAIPHGTNEAKPLVKSTGMSILVFPDGVSFGDGQVAKLVVGIAAVGDDHLDILTNVAMICSDEDSFESILNADSEERLIAIFESGMDE